MGKDSRITPEHVLYSLIFTAALLVRLITLAKVPLLESEASWAFQAWQISRGESITVGSQVGYLAVTKLLFSLFGGGDFTARLWPAFCGSLIVWIPFLLRKELHPVPALVMAGGLALDPALVAVSRLAGGSMPALVFLGLSLAALAVSRLSWAVLFAGLGILSGPDFWLGFLILCVSALISRLLGLISPLEYLRRRIANYKAESPRGFSNLLIPLLLVGLLSSFALTNYQGLSAWAGAVPEFITSWAQPGAVPLVKLFTVLLIGNPFVLFFGLMGLVRAWLDGGRAGKLLSVWLGTTLLVLLVYPDREAADLVWGAIPLWWAAAGEVRRISNTAKSSWVTYVMAGLVGVLLTLNWLTFTGMVFQYGNDRVPLLQLGLMAASLALVILSMAVISSEWGKETAWKGLAVGAGLMLLLYMVSSLTLDAYLWEKDPRSLYNEGVGSGQLDLLRDSISDASLIATGRSDSIQGTAVAGSDALRWALRDYQGIKFSDVIDIQNLEPLVITPAEDLSLGDGDAYRGQDFVISTYQGWNGVFPEDWISWIAFRFGPVEREYIILWIRNDIPSGY